MRTKSIPDSALTDLVESYQHRILSLEIELRQLGREGYLGASAYRKRTLLLKRLKAGIHNWHTEARQGNQAAPSARFLEDLPSPQACSPEEIALCNRYLSQAERFLKKLSNDSTEVINSVQKVLKGRLIPLLTTFDLSRLRAKLIRREDEINTLLQDQKQWSGFIATILKASSPMPATKGLQSLAALKQLFYQLDDLGSHIVSLRLRMEKEEEEINWMEHWLAFQELQFSQRGYLTFTPPQPPQHGPTSKRSQRRGIL